MRIVTPLLLIGKLALIYIKEKQFFYETNNERNKTASTGWLRRASRV